MGRAARYARNGQRRVTAPTFRLRMAGDRHDRRQTRMMQMTGSRRPSMVAVLALTVLSVALAGCGRKGPLEPPTSRAAVPAATTVPVAAPVP
jgi:predicted small lipoprotein YifL